MRSLVCLGIAHAADQCTAPQNAYNGFVSTVAGAPVDEIENSETVGARGPILLQDQRLVELLTHMNRERIPERVVHARGATALGEFTCTNPDLQKFTAAKFLTAGKKTELALRFSTVIHEKGSPESLRDPRGFALKFYTEEGNYDVVGLNFPVFFIRDGIKFPQMIRSLKPNPVTGQQQWWRIMDFFSNYPESTHMFTWLLHDDGIPKSYRTVNGWGVHTYVWIANDRPLLVRYKFVSEQGVHSFETDEEAYAQLPFSGHTAELYNAIEEGNFPKWKWFVQMIDPFDEQLINSLSFDLLDTTKQWPEDDPRFPMIEVGDIVLNKNIDSQFLQNEQIAFSPHRMVPGILPSDEKMLQTRLFSYADSQRYRVGVNNQMLPINAPRCPFSNPAIDGSMNFQDPTQYALASEEINYFPSMMADLKEADKQPTDPRIVNGAKVRQHIPLTNDFEQATKRYQNFTMGEKERFTARVVTTLSDKNLHCRNGGDKVVKTWLDRWTKVDAELGSKVKTAVDEVSVDCSMMKNKRMAEGMASLRRQ